MNRTSYNFLRVGIAITFLWIGLLILKDPLGWSGYISNQWVLKALPKDLSTVMIVTGAFDITVGFWLLLDIHSWIPAGLATVHLVTVLLASGITTITIRDIGLLTATLAIAMDAIPSSFIEKITSGQVLGAKEKFEEGEKEK